MYNNLTPEMTDRVVAFDLLFKSLISADGRNYKMSCIENFKRAHFNYVDDLIYILETLDGRHPIGFTLVPSDSCCANTCHTLKEAIQKLESLPDKRQETQWRAAFDLGDLSKFLAPIVNKTLRLGIGKSCLGKTNITPMLAKKYEGSRIDTEVIVTEKLDGNRCIAVHEQSGWKFYSRSGKPLNVSFNMTGLNTDLIYDGEVMSTEQTKLSNDRYDAILNNTEFESSIDMQQSQLLFNKTSGLINSNSIIKTGLVYNIFDIVSNECYITRRKLLEQQDYKWFDGSVRILPTLYVGRDINIVNQLLDSVTSMGGEGVMLNKLTRGYEHKRTDALLKYKQVQFMDMRVTDISLGTGKYTDMIGNLVCEITTNDGKYISCAVGSGLSDSQRLKWALNPELILNKIVQIGYHELTQSAECTGTNIYSVRFPRLIKIRGDKNETSEF